MLNCQFHRCEYQWSCQLLRFLFARVSSCLPVSPQFLHHVLHLLTPLCWSHLSVAFSSKLGHVHLGKLLQGKRPAVKTRPKPDGADDGINLRQRRRVVSVSRNERVDVKHPLEWMFLQTLPWCFPWALFHPLHKWRWWRWHSPQCAETSCRARPPPAAAQAEHGPSCSSSEPVWCARRWPAAGRSRSVHTHLRE